MSAFEMETTGYENHSGKMIEKNLPSHEPQSE
jgi:hypothetical protein